MLTQDIILLVLEIVGTVAFAVSGAFVAIKARLDVFGVLFIGCITAVGGGIMRDVIIGCIPPAIFSRVYMLGIAAGSALIVFIVAYFKWKNFDEFYKRVEAVSNVFDALGLAAFSVMGTEIAFSRGIEGNVLLAVLLGVLSGVGGGVLRDVLTSTTPYIFKKHVYALASIGGSVLYYLIRSLLAETLVASIVATVFVVALRMLAARFCWSLPKVKIQDAGTAVANQADGQK